MNFYRLANQFGDYFNERPIERVDYINTRPRSFDPHTLAQVKADLKRWADEGDQSAAEALREMEEMC